MRNLVGALEAFGFLHAHYESSIATSAATISSSKARPTASVG
jgi:hypothetical protein